VRASYLCSALSQQAVLASFDAYLVRGDLQWRGELPGAVLWSSRRRRGGAGAPSGSAQIAVQGRALRPFQLLAVQFRSSSY
jgi:hypothetical protein